jgi:hypothetical protein
LVCNKIIKSGFYSSFFFAVYKRAEKKGRKTINLLCL